jgi:hypothetical protein
LGQGWLLKSWLPRENCLALGTAAPATGDGHGAFFGFGGKGWLLKSWLAPRKLAGFVGTAASATGDGQGTFWGLWGQGWPLKSWLALRKLAGFVDVGPGGRRRPRAVLALAARARLTGGQSLLPFERGHGLARQNGGLAFKGGFGKGLSREKGLVGPKGL